MKRCSTPSPPSPVETSDTSISRPDQRRRLRIMILAGEASGERHGADLIAALRREYPDTAFEFFGSGGMHMRHAGAEVLVDITRLGIFGMVETARALGRIYRTFRQLRQAAIERHPDAVVLIDWPEFNLRLVKHLNRAGLPTIYYISPQIWAWRRYRLRRIRRYVDKMIVILPFELDFYRQAGMDVEFVGHPLLDSVRATKERSAFCAEHGLDPCHSIISLLPGSRRSELQHILPVMVETAFRLHLTGAQFVIPLAQTIDRRWAESLISDTIGRVSTDPTAAADPSVAPAPPHLTVIEHDTYNALAHSDLAVVASGTATLEAALLETPLIIVYRSSELNWHLVRPLLHIDTFGMVNLIAGEKIVPELIQRDMNPARLAETVLDLLEDGDRRAAIRQRLKQVKQSLGEGHAAARAARIVMEALHRRA